ncbi:thioredoxin family protein [Flammeovirga agarivorans]|uniref:Thioredoxin family protein n=1 Tax=Flammeovirga agarivorans TaxID=2726742 RepID=A0A7X8SJ36_9BACT|nr:thioredoxin family protein [Flammeovirga agarivorans]NLR91166.1 thioredoxin family protein [Flammeovirga agarivorans]
MFEIPNTVMTVQNIDELNLAIQENKKVILDFSTEWCPPCRVMKGTISNLSFELEGVAKVIKVDPEKLEAVAKNYNIKGIPYFIGLVDSKETGRAHGIVPIQQLKRLIHE